MAGVVLTENYVLAMTRQDRLENVKNINFWGRDLVDISVIQRMPNLEVVSVSLNRISSLKDFVGCKKLKELYIRKNEISDYHELDHLADLPELRIIWMEGNPCTEAPLYREHVICTLRRLVRLDSADISPEERVRCERALASNRGRQGKADAPPSSSPETSDADASPVLPPVSARRAARKTASSSSASSTASTSSAPPSELEDSPPMEVLARGAKPARERSNSGSQRSSRGGDRERDTRRDRDHHGRDDREARDSRESLRDRDAHAHAHARRPSSRGGEEEYGHAHAPLSARRATPPGDALEMGYQPSHRPSSSPGSDSARQPVSRSSSHNAAFPPRRSGNATPGDGSEQYAHMHTQPDSQPRRSARGSAEGSRESGRERSTSLEQHEGVRMRRHHPDEPLPGAREPHAHTQARESPVSPPRYEDRLTSPRHGGAGYRGYESPARHSARGDAPAERYDSPKMAPPHQHPHQHPHAHGHSEPLGSPRGGYANRAPPNISQWGPPQAPQLSSNAYDRPGSPPRGNGNPNYSSYPRSPLHPGGPQPAGGAPYNAAPSGPYEAPQPRPTHPHAHAHAQGGVPQGGRRQTNILYAVLSLLHELETEDLAIVADEVRNRMAAYRPDARRQLPMPARGSGPPDVHG